MLFSLNIFFFFFFFFFFFWVGGIYFYLYDLIFVFDYVFFSFNSCFFSFLFLFDWMSMIFMSLIFLISGCVLIYSLDYMSGELNFIRFFFLVFLFIISMVFLIIMPDIICLLLGWDGLGLVSYCLIIYYQNKSSLFSGYLTLFINRLGDIFLIFGVCWCFNFGCWHYFYFIFNSFGLDNFYVFFFIFLSCLVSSAQIPFSSWLPAAMSAPTPVSSLVHSSTLVTAGVYLLIRFNYFVCDFFSFYLMFISLMTIFISGLSALYENDLSKIVAFSTLSQLGFMFFCLSLGCYYLCFIHLLIHAVFKSLLFLCSGFFIHSFRGFQDIRFMGNLVYQSPFISSCFFVSLISMCGFPFFSGFYSSDFILEVFILSDVGFFFFFFFSLFLTVIYSLRLCYYLFFGGCFFFSYLCFYESFYMSFSCFILFIFSIFIGSLFFWFFDNLFILIFDFYFKFIPLFILFISFFFFLNLFFYINSFYFNYFLFFFGSMWFLPFFSSSFFSSSFFVLGGYLFNLVELGWSEYLTSVYLLSFIRLLSSFFNYFSLNSFKIYFLSFFFFFFFVMFY
uniref:NADH-ubiquinone oxidoreductase chain 5 n=1 Tax=Ugyops sp. APL-2018 TaxID=2250388 RepID=A0A3G1RJA8_9HEMI|nr:NADH dehydrogenase subunit 5 [Ugyops sp. APL-2018]